jgi:NarL family two-component system response regulator LiaR
VVANTGDARLALALCAAYHPDIVLMDLLMPYMDGVTATRLIHNKFPLIKVVVLTASVAEPLITAALEAGATSYILKAGSIEELSHAIRSAYHENSTLAPEVINVLLTGIHHPETAPKIGENLTPREHDILALMVDGLSNGKIAARLAISISTVKNHINHIYSKLGIHSRTGVVALAVKYHLRTKT